MINGIVLINKRKFHTSSKTLGIFKKNTKVKKAGIYGILDPLASGVLPIVVGEATKYLNFILSTNKSYNVKCKLGVFSECGDYEVKPMIFENEKDIIKSLSESTINETFKQYCGLYLQMPPMFSASKYKGKPLYAYARKNIVVKRNFKRRYIHNLEFLSLENDILNFNVTCSSGTYIRTLIQDISQEWNLHSCLYELNRFAVEPFETFSCIDVEDISIDNIDEYLINITDMLPDLPSIICSNDELIRLYNGLFINKDNITPDCICKLVDQKNVFYGVGIFKDKLLYPKRLMKR